MLILVGLSRPLLGDFEGDRYFLKYLVRLYLLMSMCRGVIYFVLYFCA
jgi:hypothetical protein